MKIFIRKFIFVLALFLSVYLLYLAISNSKLYIDGSLHLNGDTVDSYYEPISGNSGITTINSLINIYNNITADGYTVVKVNKTESSVDISFAKQDSVYRYYLDTTNNVLTFFNDIYENSYNGISYINVEE